MPADHPAREPGCERDSGIIYRRNPKPDMKDHSQNGYVHQRTKNRPENAKIRAEIILDFFYE